MIMQTAFVNGPNSKEKSKLCLCCQVEEVSKTVLVLSKI